MIRAMMSLAVALGLVLAAQASANPVLFTGDGDPLAAGLEDINGPSQWAADTPSPGFLMQGPGDDNGGYGLDDRPDRPGGPSGRATAELDPNKGYFVEWRVDVESSTDGPQWPGFNIGVYFWIEDASGRNIIVNPIDPNSGTVFGHRNAWGAAATGSFEMGGGFHTLRLEHPGGGANTIDIYYDGALVGDNVAMGVGDGYARVYAGNGGALASGEAVYDYYVINTEIPEPASMALLATGALCLLRRRR